MKKEIICVICPRGCGIQVSGTVGQIESIEKNECKRGYAYAETEFLNPCRILTSSVLLDNAYRNMLPVRSSAPIPKKLLLDCMCEIKKHRISAPVEMHQVIISDILGSGADIISSMPIRGEV